MPVVAGATSTVAVDATLTAPSATYHSTSVPDTVAPAAMASPLQNTYRPGWNTTAPVTVTACGYTFTAPAPALVPIVGLTPEPQVLDGGERVANASLTAVGSVVAPLTDSLVRSPVVGDAPHPAAITASPRTNTVPVEVTDSTGHALVRVTTKGAWLELTEVGEVWVSPRNEAVSV